MLVAVVGHTEWIDFVSVERVPVAGEIVHARAAWQEPGGGGAVAAVQAAKLAGECVFFTAVGADAYGPRTVEDLRSRGVRVEAVVRDEPHRRGLTFVDEAGERTITVIGDRLGPSGDDPLPWSMLDDAGAVYFTAGDVAALERARAARVLVATPRAMETLAVASVQIDVLIGSGHDPSERYEPGDIDPSPRVVVRTFGADGGEYTVDGGPARRYPPTPAPGPVLDAYGCGDSFAAGVTVGLGRGWAIEDALVLGARCGAANVTGRGPYEGQLVENPFE